MSKTTPREAEAQKFIRQINRQLGVVECVNCGAQHTVDLDEDGGGAIDQEPCHDDDCTVMLCDRCPTQRDDARLGYCDHHQLEVG